MSSESVRNYIMNHLETESAEIFIDLTGHYEELSELLAEAGVQPEGPWVGVEFIGDEELPISLAATNDQGHYREYGSIVIHVASIAKLGVGNSIVQRGDVLRNLFRGARIGSVVIESVTPVNTGRGATLEFEGGYMSGTFTASYYMDLNLTP